MLLDWLEIAYSYQANIVFVYVMSKERSFAFMNLMNNTPLSRRNQVKSLHSHEFSKVHIIPCVFSLTSDDVVTTTAAPTTTTITTPLATTPAGIM